MMKNEAADKTEAKKPSPLRYLQPVVDRWSVRERLALATAVSQDNDKHWPSISKTVKPFASEKRDEDYFAPRKCARQYADLLENIEQPRRRGEAAVYDCTPEEMLVKRLTLDRIEELQNHVKKLQRDYEKTKAEVCSIKNGSMDNRTLTRLYNELKEKEKAEEPGPELIPVSEADVARLEAAGKVSRTKSSASDAGAPGRTVMDASDFGLAADDDYETDTARMDASRREVLRAIAGSKEVKPEAMEEEPVEVEPVEVEVKEEAETTKELAPVQSPSASSASSSPRRAESEEVDDEATEAEEEEEEAEPVDDKAYRTWKKSINMIIRAAQSHKHASVFLTPVTDDIAAGYSQVISRPMDLSTIKRRVDNGEIRTTAEFQRDVMLMFTNAVMYNNAEHDVHKMALEMYDDVMNHIEQYLSTQVMSPSVESKVLRRRVSDHNRDMLHQVSGTAIEFSVPRGYNTRRRALEEEQTSRRRRCSADSDKRDEQPPPQPQPVKKSRK